MLAPRCMRHVKPWRSHHHQRTARATAHAQRQQSDASASRLNMCGTRADRASTDAVVRPDLSDGFMVMYSTSPRAGHGGAPHNAAWIAAHARRIMDF